jgi:hypothetical protein
VLPRRQEYRGAAEAESVFSTRGDCCMKKLSLALILGAAACLLSQGKAEAIPLFNTKFQERYASSAAPAEFVTLVKETTKCNVCHILGEEKKVRNGYGESLKKAGLMKTFAMKIKEDEAGTTKAIQDAFDKVEKEKTVAGKTYGELLKAGKLPGEK